MRPRRTTASGILIAALIGLTASAAEVPAVVSPPYAGGDVFADTWVATDALGREVPGHAEAGPPRVEKFVGIFYWTWHHGEHAAHDVTKILAEAAATGGAPKWGPVGAPHHWGEPELGYYRATDPFVIRKHASMLADAGVDVVLFDTTNPPHTFRPQYEALCREYAAMRAEGNRTPGIGFITPFGDPRPVTRQLWRDLYGPGHWRDLWFPWDNKPLLLADPAFITDPAQRAFFTIRRAMPDYWIGPTGRDQWSWLEVYPQHEFLNARGDVEQMSVGVAQNALPDTPGPAAMSHRRGAMGRSWHGGKRDASPGAVHRGLNFQEQWDRALKVDPRFVFVTGWNEWVAGRFLEWSVYKESDAYLPGGLFVDQYDHEYSRDCEPMRGGHGDSYYYQLASNVRRFKGARPRPTASGPSPIKLDGAFGDWARVVPEFRDTIGDTIHRDHPGYGDLRYRNATGRNDIVIAKAAYDDANVYFYAQTLKRLTPHADRNWMVLFVDADQNAKTGWLGYDFAVNREVASDAETTLKAWKAGRWEPVARVPYRAAGNGLELAVPRELIGEAAEPPAFDFHWADNPQTLDDASDFGVNGDSAPNRRWNYRFEVGKEHVLR